MDDALEIRKAISEDTEGIWKIFSEVIASGDTYVYHPLTTKEQFVNHWLSPNGHTFVALLDEKIVATYILKANQIDLGNHIANVGYMVASDYNGRGIGQRICTHSLDTARQMGFAAMQFNFVVSTNHGAVSLWKKNGFDIIGTIPDAFRHQNLGLVDAYIMYRKL